MLHLSFIYCMKFASFYSHFSTACLFFYLFFKTSTEPTCRDLIGYSHTVNQGSMKGQVVQKARNFQKQSECFHNREHCRGASNRCANKPEIRTCCKPASQGRQKLRTHWKQTTQHLLNTSELGSTALT